MPKPSDILAVRIVILHVWTKLNGCRDVKNCEHLQRRDVQLMSVAARVCVSVTQRQETDTNLSQNCFTKLFWDLIRQNSSKRWFASMVLASATFSGPGSLLIRTRLAVVSACNHFQSHVLMTEALQNPLLLSNPMALVLSGTRMDVHVLSTSMDQSLDVLRFTCGCGGRDLFSFT